MRAFCSIFLAIASGVSLAMVFTPFDQAWLVWGWMWLLLPVLWSLSTKRAKLKGFALGWLAGFSFWAINLKWLGSVTWPGAMALAAYLAIYFALFGVFAASAGNPWRKAFFPAKTMAARASQAARSLGYAVILAGFWCGLEWLRGWVLTGFGWNGLGVAFAKNLILAQNAEFIGVTGLSFLPVFLSAVVVQVVWRVVRQFREGDVRMLHWDFATALIVLMASLTVGGLRLSAITNAPKIEGKVLLVQQNIPQIAGRIMWDPQRVVDGFIELTEAGLAEVEARAARELIEANDENQIVTLKKPDLVVWPEACLRDFLKLSEEGPPRGGPGIESIFDYVSSLGDFTFVTGINEYRGETPMAAEAEVFNSLVSQDSEGKRESYQKHHLVILGEYIPELPFLRELYYDAAGVEFGSGMTPGESFDNLKLQLRGHDVAMMPSICFEDTVPRVTRRFVRNEPQVLVNITNDGWFGETEGGAQHFRNALFRTIELRRPMIRAANRGVTGVVSATGSLVDPITKEKRHLVDENGSHFHRGFLLANVYVPAEGQVTLYAKYGDWFAVVGLLAAFVWSLLRWISKRNPAR